MSGRSVRDFLELLDSDPAEGVLRIKRSVSTEHELWAVVKQLESRGTETILFENVSGSDFPVLVGLAATRGRIALALGQEEDECVGWFVEKANLSIPPRSVTSAPVHHTCMTGDEVDLGKLPIGTHSPGDSGPYLSAGITCVQDPDTGNMNAGIYRIMVLDSTHVTLNTPPSHDLGKILDRAAEADEPVEVAIVIGHPVLAIGSQAKNPLSVDSYGLVGSLMGAPLEVAQGKTIGMSVPANAEFVLEGKVMPKNRAAEGPFGEFAYTYGSALGYVCEITAITHRRDPIFVDLHPTHVEHRQLWLFPGREARLLQRLQEVVPQVRDVRLPVEGFAMTAYVSIDKIHDGDVRRVMMTAFAHDIYIKHLVVIDGDVNIDSSTDILRAVTIFSQADTDWLVIPNCRGPRTDPSGYTLDARDGGSMTTKVGIDATPRLGSKKVIRADQIHPDFRDLDLAKYLSQ